jgi:hypothetical protein
LDCGSIATTFLQPPLLAPNCNRESTVARTELQLRMQNMQEQGAIQGRTKPHVTAG